MNEEEIISLLRAGEEQGAEELLRHYTPLMRYINLTHKRAKSTGGAAIRRSSRML